jgi:AraC-like DNA-binding protein
MKPVRGRLPSQHSVRAIIAASLRHGDESLPRTASQLGISCRSLQRHLAEAGTSYSKMVAEVRLDTACRLLAESNERLSDIALRLGYAGPSSFSRTFMRLMQIQPVAYRRQQRNDKARRGKRSQVASQR